MQLSKIWSSFIIISALAALLLYVFRPQDKNIFSRMVVGKSGDVYYEQQMDARELTIAQKATLDSVPFIQSGNPDLKIRKNGEGYVSYYTQKSDGFISTAQTAVEICLGLIGIMTLFMGIMQIAENAGGIRLLSRMIGPFFEKLFPDVPKGHASFGHMMLNFSANLLGLDNAATPFGLKAMESLQELNPSKTTASNPQIMFLCLHAAGMTLIPVSIIAIRSSLGASNPTDIFLPCMIATFAATMAAMVIVSIRQRINLFQPVIIAWVGGISVLIALLIVFLYSMQESEMKSFSGMLSNGLILLIIFAIVAGAWYKKINVFEAFIEGAKGGFTTSIKIIPYLVGMLVAISMLRTSGVFDLVIDGFKYLFHIFHLNQGIADALPTALIKPLSGSGARGMMVDTINQFGADSFAGRLSAVFQGSSDTTFYVIAVYFGAVSINNTKYTVSSMLLADLAGIITAILITTYWPWGG
ncbi:MAG: spore maturation protein [Taibaiella sp.]|nr:spore maturation protein [Taibaiella sp.]